MANNIEIWKDIIGFEGLYKVSNTGRVQGTKGILKGRLSGNGYVVVSLGENYKFKNYYIHRLVSIHFIENPNNYKVVNHIDGIKENNNVSNLEWTTQSKNLYHAYDTNLKSFKNKSSRYKGVYLHKGSNKWISRRGNEYLGSFENEYDAYLAYKNKVDNNG